MSLFRLGASALSVFLFTSFVPASGMALDEGIFARLQKENEALACKMILTNQLSWVQRRSSRVLNNKNLVWEPIAEGRVGRCASEVKIPFSEGASAMVCVNKDLKTSALDTVVHLWGRPGFDYRAIHFGDTTNYLFYDALSLKQEVARFSQATEPDYCQAALEMNVPIQNEITEVPAREVVELHEVRATSGLHRVEPTKREAN